MKLVFLGREQLELRSGGTVWTLRIHELCVLAMLVGGGKAGWCAYQMRPSRNVTQEATAIDAFPEVVIWHRRAGWSAVIGAGLAFLAACLVLIGMYQRLAFD